MLSDKPAAICGSLEVMHAFVDETLIRLLDKDVSIPKKAKAPPGAL